MTRLHAAAETHTGYVRSTNQDVAVVAGDLVAVADGMGGHLGGEVAARTAIEELLEAFLRERTGDGLVMAARRANRAVWRRSRIERTLHGMGTTLTAVALVAGQVGDVGDGGQPDGDVPDPLATQPGATADPGGVHLILVNVGDSRAYVLDRSTGEFRQLTEDHSVVEEMVRHGELTPAEAAVHPHRHVLTRALGIEAEVALDIWDLAAEPASRYLLCSDGLTNEVADGEIAEILAGAASPEQAVSELVERALGHGGMDNVTVVVADVVEGEDSEPASVSVQLVPPGPPLPEHPVRGTPELTEAVPITSPPGAPPPPPPPPGADEPGSASRGDGWSGGGAAGVAAGAALAAGVGGALGVVAAGAEGVAGTGATGVGALGAGAVAGTGAAGAGADGAAGAAGVAGAGVISTGGDGGDAGRASNTRIRDTGHGSGPDTQATSLIDRAEADVEDGAGPPGAGVALAGGEDALDSPAGPRHRKGRSMTVRQAPTTDNGSGGGFDPQTGPPSRPVVLVPQTRVKSTRDRIVTFRVFFFLVILVSLLVGTAGVVIWYDQSQYFIGLKGKNVAIYQGRPGGMLWFKPQLIETSRIRTTELLGSSIAVLRAGLSESSLQAAEQVVARLKNEKKNALAAATTTTTKPPPPTLPAASTTTFPNTVPTSTLATTTTTSPPTTSTTIPPRQTTTTIKTQPGGGGKPPHHSTRGT
jgi:protein phosphatase